MVLMVALSRPSKGSSSNKTGGFINNNRAKARRLRCPPERSRPCALNNVFNVLGKLSTQSDNETDRSTDH